MMRKIAYDWGMGKTFRENLREELDYKGISVKQLSDMTGISKRTLENYLGNKETIPPADYACKIAAVLNVTVEYLVNGYKAPTVELEKYDFKTTDYKQQCVKPSNISGWLFLFCCLEPFQPCNFSWIAGSDGC